MKTSDAETHRGFESHTFRQNRDLVARVRDERDTAAGPFFTAIKESDNMTIIDKPIDELIPYANNPRHNDDAVFAVANSISQFGFKVPVVVDKENVIVCGHTRYKAAQKLGLKTIPCIIADDLTPEQINAFRLADNKTAELADWDMSKLEEELQELVNDFDMEDFGFNLILQEVSRLFRR